MQVESLARIFKNLHAGAPKREKKAVAVLFGIHFAVEIDEGDPRRIAEITGINLATEIYNGRSISKYVILNPDAKSLITRAIQDSHS